MSDIRLLNLDNNIATFTLTLRVCRYCNKPMLSSWMSGHLYQEIATQGDIPREHHSIDNVCWKCVDSGTYTMHCAICDNLKMMPQDFRFHITNYSKYPDGETEYTYICKSCITDNPGYVIDALAIADEVKDLED